MLLFFVVNSITDQTQLPEPELQVLKLGSSKSRTEEQQNESRSFIQSLLDNCSPRSIIAFTDGSCQPNPGPCGAGSCILPERPELPERPPKYRKDQRIIGGYLKQSIF